MINGCSRSEKQPRLLVATSDHSLVVVYERSKFSQVFKIYTRMFSLRQIRQLSRSCDEARLDSKVSWQTNSIFQRIIRRLVQVKDYYPRISVSNCKKSWKTSKLSLLLPDVRIEFNSKLISKITGKAKICPLFRNETTSQYEYRIWICISLKHSFVTQCIFQTYKFEVRNSKIYR